MSISVMYGSVACSKCNYKNYNNQFIGYNEMCFRVVENYINILNPIINKMFNFAH
jgi:hypothetical protein